MTSIFQTSANRSPRRRQRNCGRSKQTEQKEITIADFSPAPRDEEPEKEQMVISDEQGAPGRSQSREELKDKARTLQYILETNFWACDAKWTLFVAAAYSYRYDSVLHPFPPQFATEYSGYDIDSLITVIKDTPKLLVISQNLMEDVPKEPTREVIDLLFWVLVVMREPSLRLVEGEELTSVLDSIDENAKQITPTHVFEVLALAGYHSEAAFRARIKNLPLKLGFMGNKLDNYFSLLFNGFTQPGENANRMMLTTDLQTSLQHSPYCAAWGASQCGSIISCSAICEFAVNSEEDQIIPNKNSKNCVDVYLRNPDHVRVRYLIFYGKRAPKHMQPKPRFFSWLYNHKFSFSLFSYLLLLLTIGLSNSDSGEIIKVYVSKKVELFVDFCRKFIAKEPSQ